MLDTEQPSPPNLEVLAQQRADELVAQVEITPAAPVAEAPAENKRGGARPGAGRKRKLIDLPSGADIPTGAAMRATSAEYRLQALQERAEAEIARLRARRLVVAAERNKALLPAPGSPDLALNREAASVHEAELRAIDEDLERHSGVILAARQREADERAAEERQDRLAYFDRQRALADRRLEAARRMDKIVADFATAYRDLCDSSHAFFVSMKPGYRDTTHQPTSSAGAPLAAAAARKRLRHAGVDWAHPYTLNEAVTTPPTVEEAVRGMNAHILQLAQGALEADRK